MSSTRNLAEEINTILASYNQFISIHVQKYNLSRYGLDPEDIMQEVKIRIWKLTQNDNSIKNLAPYIKKIVNSAVIDQLRKVRREDKLFRYERQKRISELKLSYYKESLHQKAAIEMVGKAVEKLITTRRQVVKLYLLGLTIKEISGYLNCSQDKARNLLYRGLANLRESLKCLDGDNEGR